MYELRSSEFFSNRSSSAIIPPGMDVKLLPLQDGLSVSLISYQSTDDICATAYNDGVFVHFSYLFKGSVEVGFDNRRLSFEVGNLLTSYAPGQRFCLQIPKNYQNIELLVTPETLASLAGDDYDHIGDGICRGFCLRRDGCNRRACDAAARLARLMENDQAPPLLIHAATLEFIAWNLNAYQSDNACEAISPRERKLLIFAREILLNDLSCAPTITALSRATGLNQLKLKRGFRAVFNCSIYALFQRERMGHARVLLEKLTVTETAMMLGYSNVSHFSSAFKKQFGMLPREARRGAPG